MTVIGDTLQVVPGIERRFKRRYNMSVYVGINVGEIEGGGIVEVNG